MSGASAEGQIAGDDSIVARTADGQEVRIDASVIFSIDPSEVVDVHVDWQNRYTDSLIRPKVRGIARDSAARYNVQEIYSVRRDDLSQEIETELSSVLYENGLILDDFVLRNITFTPEYASVIEQKQIAEQEVERQAFVVRQREQEAEQLREQSKGQADAAVIAAEGKAKSIMIEAEAQALASEQQQAQPAQSVPDPSQVNLQAAPAPSADQTGTVSSTQETQPDPAQTNKM